LSSTQAGLRYDVDGRMACLADRTVELTAREAALFQALINTGNRIVVRDLLTDRLYGEAGEVSANALEASISRLRRKLVILDSDISIETVRGIGYRLKQGPSTG
jgi:DNA-binding response OmpR family regulator